MVNDLHEQAKIPFLMNFLQVVCHWIISALTFTHCSVGQVSTPPSSRSRSRRRWTRVWRYWRPWAGRCSWATARRCSTAPPRRCAPRWCLSTPACWHPWALTLSWESLTQPRPPASTCRTSKSSRSSGEFFCDCSSDAFCFFFFFWWFDQGLKIWIGKIVNNLSPRH